MTSFAGSPILMVGGPLGDCQNMTAVGCRTCFVQTMTFVAKQKHSLKNPNSMRKIKMFLMATLGATSVCDVISIS